MFATTWQRGFHLKQIKYILNLSQALYLQWSSVILSEFYEHTLRP